MTDLAFDRNSRTALDNHRKHGVSFGEAKSAFLDENARVIPDPGHSGDEDRFVLPGHSVRLQMPVVVHCYREDDEIIRIISARKAERSEQRQYTGFLL